MSLEKERDYRFTFKDAQGKLRVVYLQAQHFQEDGQDRVLLQATTDGVAFESKVFVDETLSSRSVTSPTELGAG